jgi:predicted dienelactone hydrolase
MNYRISLAVMIVLGLSTFSDAQIVRGRNREQRQGKAVDQIQLAGLNVAVWKPSQSGPAPLIVFSHGYHGCNTQSTSLMTTLANAGYLVVAPNHKDAICEGGGLQRPEEPFQNPGAWNDATYAERRDDVVRLMDALRTNNEWRERINWSAIGLAGHSLGGYTVLGLAGAWPNWRLKGAVAVLALSPYCEPFLRSGQLGSMGIPIMFQGGTRDLGITPSVKKPNGCYSAASSPAYFVELQGAGHFAWTDLNTTYQDIINRYSIAFFDKHLRNRPGAKPEEKVAGVSDLRTK